MTYVFKDPHGEQVMRVGAIRKWGYRGEYIKMHGTAKENWKFFVEKFIRPGATGSIIDVGAQDINGTVRDLIPEGFTYTGVDCARGKNVDVVAQDPYKLEFSDGHADIVMSTSTLEHVEFFWLLFTEMARVTKTNGLIYLNVPTAGPYHPCPVDCWRFYPDAGAALERWSVRSGMPVKLLYGHVTEFTFTDEEGNIVSGDQWRDWTAIYRRMG